MATREELKALPEAEAGRVMTAKPRHKWISMPMSQIQFPLMLHGMSFWLPELPARYEDTVPVELQKLQRCEHCHWVRLGTRSERGNQDWAFHALPLSPQKLVKLQRWHSYLAGHNPRCGEQKK